MYTSLLTSSISLLITDFCLLPTDYNWLWVVGGEVDDQYTGLHEHHLITHNLLLSFALPLTFGGTLAMIIWNIWSSTLRNGCFVWYLGLNWAKDNLIWKRAKKRYVSRKVEKCMTKVNCIGFPRANVMDLIHPRNGDKFTETFKYSGRGQKESRKSTKMSLFI